MALNSLVRLPGAQTGGYKSPYSIAMGQLVNKVVNRQPFTYDHNTDPQFQALAKTYGRLGDRARVNTMADVAGNTGGMVSSWAVTAGQMAQNDYNQQLSDQIPALMEAAYNRYSNEFSMNNQALGSVMDLDNSMYGRYADNRDYTRGVYESDRGYNRDVLESDRSYNYQASRDKVSDSQWLKEYNLQKISGKSGSGGGSGGDGGDDKPKGEDSKSTSVTEPVMSLDFEMRNDMAFSDKKKKPTNVIDEHLIRRSFGL